METEEYDQSRKKAGIAIIFNFEDFFSYKTYPKRKDELSRLISVLGDLNIDVGDRVYRNLTKAAMIVRIKECMYLLLLTPKVI